MQMDTDAAVAVLVAVEQRPEHEVDRDARGAGDRRDRDRVDEASCGSLAARDAVRLISAPSSGNNGTQASSGRPRNCSPAA